MRRVRPPGTGRRMPAGCWFPTHLHTRHLLLTLPLPMRFPGWPNASTFLLALPIAATFGMIREHRLGLGRGDRLARLPASATHRQIRLAARLSHQRMHLGRLALPAAFNGGLQLGHAQALRNYLLHIDGHRKRLSTRLASSQIQQPLALRDAPCQPQSFRAGRPSIAWTAPAGRALYITTEFGIGMVITCAITAYFLWRDSSFARTCGLRSS